MSSGNKFQIDMCHGSLFKKIILFAVPLTITNVLQLLFQATDLVVLGQFADKGSMAAVGATGGFTVLILNIFFGISVGANVLAAQYTGAKDNLRLSRTIHTAAAIGLSFGSGFYEGGLLGTLVAILVNMLLPKIEYRYKLSRVSYVFYVEIASVYDVQRFVDSVEKNYPIQEVEITKPNSGHSSHVGVNIIVFARQTDLSEEQILEDLSAREETVFAIKTV